jgi:molybdate transport system substrate-binding protein
VQTAYGSSGNFYAQIRNQAPFDIFLSADAEYPRKLIAEGIGARDSLFVYAAGRIVVWVPASSPLDPATALRAASVRHIAIANPQHAPYGRAAEAALRSLGLYDSIAGKLVLGEDVAQTLEFVQSGAADVGIVALSLALAPPVRGQGRYWEVPGTAYPKIEQGGVVLKDSQAAREFRSFLLGAGARRILKQYGFSLPEA